MTSTAVLTSLRARWRTLAPREQTLVLGATVVVLLALLWWVGIGPALRVLRQAEVQQRNLDTQLQRMQAMASEAQALAARPAMPYNEALRALEASVKTGLGPGGQFQLAGEGATVTLKNVPAAALAQWLAQARLNARALPSEARLVQGTALPGGGVTWNGTLVMRLPPR